MKGKTNKEVKTDPVAMKKTGRCHAGIVWKNAHRSVHSFHGNKWNLKYIYTQIYTKGNVPIPKLRIRLDHIFANSSTRVLCMSDKK